MIRCPVCASLYSGPGHDCAAAVQERVRAAERAAAERMRERCIDRLGSILGPIDLATAAAALRALPLDSWPLT